MNNQFEQEQLIKSQVAKFADAVNVGDRDLFMSLWLPEGVWTLNPPMDMVVTGKENIGNLFTELLDNWEFFVQMVHTGVIEIKGQEAIARWCMSEIGRSHQGKGFQNYGIYQDKLVYQDNQWLFSQRIYHFSYIEEPQLSGNAFKLPKNF
ncbi:nuclear transport factor 2 family protein [Cyanobacterium stanieri LEGE 03274]|uniref:Nuclear transport factor 2 family protein n=1 Tax=Cyanobacterium stanieri LEGE 03274 TaxID=1828756 RepID=A0ABR9V385_9CHRO|nr:nuclear transport factor 2 family protein [Cyanobacterium stanieri]MBE9222360.1 nuclear transport factor 2 family protein [Cyanobacterium stanieri LEGE 03274]